MINKKKIVKYFISICFVFLISCTNGSNKKYVLGYINLLENNIDNEYWNLNFTHCIDYFISAFDTNVIKAITIDEGKLLQINPSYEDQFIMYQESIKLNKVQTANSLEDFLKINLIDKRSSIAIERYWQLISLVKSKDLKVITVNIVAEESKGILGVLSVFYN